MAQEVQPRQWNKRSLFIVIVIVIVIIVIIIVERKHVEGEGKTGVLDSARAAMGVNGGVMLPPLLAAGHLSGDKRKITSPGLPDQSTHPQAPLF